MTKQTKKKQGGQKKPYETKPVQRRVPVELYDEFYAILHSKKADRIIKKYKENL